MATTTATTTTMTTCLIPDHKCPNADACGFANPIHPAGAEELEAALKKATALDGVFAVHDALVTLQCSGSKHAAKLLDDFLCKIPLDVAGEIIHESLAIDDRFVCTKDDLERFGLDEEMFEGVDSDDEYFALADYMDIHWDRVLAKHKRESISRVTMRGAKRILTDSSSSSESTPRPCKLTRH